MNPEIYCNQLLEQLSSENLRVLLVEFYHFKFRLEEDNLVEIQRRRDGGVDSVRDPELCRFARGGMSQDPNLPGGDFPSYKDSRFPDYNANQYPSGYFVCEGPAPGHEAHLERFIKSLFFNQTDDVNITHVLVAGQPGEGALFYDYFSCGFQSASLQIVSEQKPIRASHVHEYQLTIDYRGEQKSVDLYQLTHMPDHHAATLIADDMRLLYELAINVPPQQLVAHCAGGLGRSPSILLALTLFKDFTSIFAGSARAISNKIAYQLEQFRQTRPGSVQRIDQLIQAIHLAIELKRIDWSLYPDRFQSDRGDLTGALREYSFFDSPETPIVGEVYVKQSL